MSIYYKYASDGTKTAILSYFDDCIYWYTYEALGKWFVDSLGKIFCVNLLGYAYWFMSNIISHMKDHYISVYQARYATSIVTKYLDTSTGNKNTKFYKTNFTPDILMHLPVRSKLRS